MRSNANVYAYLNSSFFGWVIYTKEAPRKIKVKKRRIRYEEKKKMCLSIQESTKTSHTNKQTSDITMNGRQKLNKEINIYRNPIFLSPINSTKNK